MKVTYSTAFFPETFDRTKLAYFDRKGELQFNIVDRDPAAIKRLIRRIEKQINELPQAEMPVTHTLIDGVYTRSLFIKKGALLIGKTHLKECVNIVAKGDITVLTETGLGRFQAGYVATSQPGIQKLGYAHEDTVFINVFRTDKTEIAEIEAEISHTELTAIEAEKEPLLCL